MITSLIYEPTPSPINMNILKTTLLLFLLSIGIKGYSQEYQQQTGPFDSNRPDGQAPLGILTDQVRGKGQWMIAYSYLNLMNSGNQSAISNISNDAAFQNYAAVPQTMMMQSHQLTVMYGFSDRLTFMAQGSYNFNSMTLNMDPTLETQQATGAASPPSSISSSSSGLGDTKITALYKIIDIKPARLIAGFGLSIPTGSIEQKTNNVAGDTVKSSYVMQNGTGSVSIMPSVTYLGQNDYVSWGIVLNANIQTGSNTEGYEWGNQYKANVWLAYKFSPNMSVSLRAEGSTTGPIRGYDTGIASLSANDPTANTINYGGNVIYGYAGLNFYVPSGPLKNFRVALEYGMPVYQNLNGTQMTQTMSLNAGIRYSF